MAAKLTRLTHKISIKLHLVAESSTICSSRSRRPVRKLLDTPSYSFPALGMSLLRLIKMCLNETYSEVCTGENLSDAFPIQNTLKQGDAL
jgi:hypothetical protein